MMPRSDQISATDWQLELGGEGTIVEGRADIEQCLRIIVATPKGTVPLRPSFGCDAWRYLDAPLPEARVGVAREVTEAIRLWEPRAELVSVQLEAAGAGLLIRLQWRPAAGGTVQTSEVTL